MLTLFTSSSRIVFPKELSSKALFSIALPSVALFSLILASAAVTTTPVHATQPIFVRGECNSDGAVDIADAIYLLNFSFVPGTPPPICEDACDANDDGLLNIADVITVLSLLFIPGSPPLTAPYPDCGIDITDWDALFCSDSTAGCDSGGLYFELLDFGSQSGLPPTQVIIRNEADWIDLWLAHWSVVIPAPPLPAIDFFSFMVVAVVEPLGQPETMLEPLSVSEMGGTIEVELMRYHCPSPITILETPWTFVLVEAIPGDLSVTFLDVVCP